MKQVVIVGHGGPEKLQLRESPDPEPRQGEVRIRVRASGINFADILAREGLYPDAPRPPAVVGYEVSGSVDKVGGGVDDALIGTDVVALTRFGGYSDVVTVPAKQVFEKPAMLSHEQAATIPVSYLTAWQLLVVMGSLKPGETVLIHNAGGGVGLAAIDVATHVGATIFGTASAGKHPFLTERGVHETIDYRTTDWPSEVDRLTGGKGVSLVIDPFGGRHWKKSYRALRSGGRLGMFGVSAATDFETARTASTRAARGRDAGLPPGVSDECEQVGLRRESGSHVARDRHDRGLGASRARRGSRRVGASPRGQHVPARRGGCGACLHRRTQEHRQSHPHDVTQLAPRQTAGLSWSAVPAEHRPGVDGGQQRCQPGAARGTVGPSPRRAPIERTWP